ncbi:SIR2 family protein [Salipaludibacillus sp. CF4.18]|uniref:SIR2 family protein n=1 Tax=Salipaludibacillus sp. CF4.18 TaxID=3373081 RepID=UPI003EE748EB
MDYYNVYLEESMDELLDCIKKMQCRPILFVGSGLSRRYMEAPSWKGLLQQIVDENPLIDSPLEYYIMNTRINGKENLPEVAKHLVDDYFKFAWLAKTREDGIFPEQVYSGDLEKDIYIKCKAVSIIERSHKEFIRKFSDEQHDYMEELSLLSDVDPHAIITTNYDEMLEVIFPNYEVIVGQQIIRRSMYTHVGEILKIHGTTLEPTSIVLSQDDYDKFKQKKKYLSAQMLTYFIEHPLVILGYSVQDENIKSILSDIAEMLDDVNTLLPNIWLVEWQGDIDETKQPPKEKLIDLGNNRSLRVNLIVVNSYSKLYKTLGESVVVEKVNMKLLRNLSRSVYNIVRSKTTQLKVNVATLNAFSDEDHLFNVMSVQNLNPSSLTSIYQYRLTDITEEWGKHYSAGVKILEEIAEMTGYDIRSDQNKYHIDMNIGRNRPSADRWYSEAAKQLLSNVFYQRPTTVSLPNGEEIGYSDLIVADTSDGFSNEESVAATVEE